MQYADRLAQDHLEIDRLFAEAFAAVAAKSDPLKIVDLLWARLAVHIRAEHLHLFPALRAIAELDGDQESLNTIERLGEDHDIFMKRFASIMKDLRVGATEGVDHALHEIALRLADHNSIEEHRIYPLVDTWLRGTERVALRKLIIGELDNAPARFAAEDWRYGP